MGGFGHEALPRGEGGPADVRGDEAAWGGEERIGSGWGFLAEDVEACTREAIFVEGAGDRGFIQEGSAGGIDEVGRGFHVPEGFLIHDVLGLGGEGTVEGEDIAAAEERLLADVFDGGIGGGGLSAGGDEDLHAKSMSDCGNCAANPAEPEDAQRFAVQFCQWGVAEGEVGALGPGAFLDASGMMGGLECDFEKEGEHQLRN